MKKIIIILILLMLIPSYLFATESKGNSDDVNRIVKKKKKKKVRRKKKKRIFSRFIDKEKKIKLLRLDKKYFSTKKKKSYVEEVTRRLNEEKTYEVQLDYLAQLVKNCSKENELKKNYAILIIGEYNCEEKLNLLYDNIDYIYMYNGLFGKEYLYDYPVVRTLKKFDKKIIPDLIEIMRKADNFPKLQGAFEVIRHLDKNIAREFVKKIKDKNYIISDKNKYIIELYNRKMKEIRKSVRQKRKLNKTSKTSEVELN